LISVVCLPGNEISASCGCPCKVTAHGDVYITGPDIRHLYGHVYDDNGNQICEGPMK
jgi:hypothetical protein